ncbi:neutral/alkaline non-lysosomal ceramidase N-terminal domain-containing protein [Jiulongibacter sp. NS-SX5]|uniref:neutral/alkaline non-lysosomal ceramidase N-terminal domain-containing protein n=1 Tax=Jiulongibacter sp. NS-SX5 TaxID=3463854 RepID=UPI004059771C
MSLVTVIDYTPKEEMQYYRDWNENLKTLQFKHLGDDSLLVGWSKTNITPDQPMALAGYGVRKGKPFEKIHDSVYVRTIVLGTKQKQVAIVTADLLIIPPTVEALVDQKLLDNIDIYYGATHSHNSIGGWYNTLVGRLFAGQYAPDIEQMIADQILESIELASKNMSEVSGLNYEMDIDKKDIRNRLIEGGEIAPNISTLRFNTKDGKTAILNSYAAHSTVLDSKTNHLSRDYPGVLVDSLENYQVDFAAYMAGAVGSMGPIEEGQDDFDEVNNQALGVFREINSKNELEMELANSISYLEATVPLRKPSPRIGTTWALRPWVFNWLFGEASASVKAVKLDKLVLIGLPCDFSGELVQELEQYAQSKNLELMLTSFNGDYIGYITADEHFDKDKYETTTMNWFGPYNGAYFSEVVKDVLDKAAQLN